MVELKERCPSLQGKKFSAQVEGLTIVHLLFLERKSELKASAVAAW